MYSLDHLYLQTSRHESQAMSILESTACGPPAAWSEEQLAAQIVEVLGDAWAYGPLRRQARSAIESRFTLAGSFDRFRPLCGSLSGVR